MVEVLAPVEAPPSGGLWVGEVRSLVEGVKSREEAVLAAELVAELVEVARQGVAKGARPARLRLLESAGIHLARAGVHVDLGLGCRLAAEALAQAEAVAGG